MNLYILGDHRIEYQERFQQSVLWKHWEKLWEMAVCYRSTWEKLGSRGGTKPQGTSLKFKWSGEPKRGMKDGQSSNLSRVGILCC